MSNGCRIAYFSMEIGLQPDIPTYAGGLGVLAGDTIRAAADLQVPMSAVSLLHRHGYFYQRLDHSGWQLEEAVRWNVDESLQPLEPAVSVVIEGRDVGIRIWKFDVRGVSGFVVPVFLLDTDVDGNHPQDRRITDCLYNGDDYYRLCQEVVLGIGGVRALRSLGHRSIERFHMNEGHAALLTLELLREQRESHGRAALNPSDLEAVREKCVFTTHTPVAAGHDQFSLDMAGRVLGCTEACDLHGLICQHQQLNMTYLALTMSRYVNGVAKKHGETTQHMFAEYKIDSITNGVHAATWTGPAFCELFDHYIPGWRTDNSSLRSAVSLPGNEIWECHQRSKVELIEAVNRYSNAGFVEDRFTIGFARRATGYKRPDLIFENLDRLRQIVCHCGPIQIVFAGKAHPKDDLGKHLIQHIIRMSEQLKGDIQVAYLTNYDMRLAKLCVAGSDLWLNTPQPPLEASGTSGMKAALNGVPSLSVADGWWIEGCIEGITGWLIDEGNANIRSQVACSLYDKLERTIIPMFYNQRDRFIDIMRHCIAINGSFFNTHRMIQQYALKAYL